MLLTLKLLVVPGLVAAVTLVARRRGPRIGGWVTARGPAAVIAFFHGFLPALITFGLFCFVFAVGVEPLGLPMAAVLALAVQLAVHGFSLWRMTRVVAKELALDT